MDETIWLLILGVMFVIDFALFYRFRYRPMTKGDSRDLGGSEYFLQINRHKGRINGFKVTLENSSIPEFSLTRKSAFHRFFERLQSSNRMSFEQDTFPDTLKLITDNMPVRQSFIGNPNLRKIAENLLTDVKFDFAKIDSLRCYNGLLMADFRRKGDIDEVLIGNAAEQIAPKLFDVANAMQDIEPKKDPGLLKAKIVQSISAALGILCFMLFIKLVAFGNLFQVQLITFIEICVGIGLAIAIVLTFIVYSLYKESSHFHRVLTEFVSFGWVSIILLSIVVVNFVNMEYDDQSAKRTETVITNTYETVRKNKRGKSYRYFAELQNNQNPESIPDEIEISRTQYSNAKIGDKVVLHVKPGYLDFAWLEKFEIVSQSW